MNLFKFLSQTFNSRIAIYNTRYTKQEVLDKLNILFTEKSGIFKSPNLYGGFVDYPDGFQLKPKWSFIDLNKIGSNAYLTGTITDNKDGKAEISIAVRPNFILGIMCFVLFLIGIYNVTHSSFSNGNKNNNNLYIGLSILLIPIPFIILMTRGYISSLKDDFEDYMNISEEN